MSPSTKRILRRERFKRLLANAIMSKDSHLIDRIAFDCAVDDLVELNDMFNQMTGLFIEAFQTFSAKCRKASTAVAALSDALSQLPKR